jgi:hypothetical protein
MTAARITGSARADRLRLSFHVSTSDQDADLAADVLRPHVTCCDPCSGPWPGFFEYRVFCPSYEVCSLASPAPRRLVIKWAHSA